MAGWQKLWHQGFFSFPFILYVSPLLLALWNSAGVLCHLNLVNHYMPGWLQEGAGMAPELRAVGQEVALFTLCWPPVCSWSRTSLNQRFLFYKEGMTEKVEESSLKHREWISVNCEEALQEERTTSCGRGCVSEFCEMTIPGPQLSIWPVQLASTSYRSSDLVFSSV